MPESVLSFQSLPDDYQKVIELAQQQHNVSIKPLQELVGGWSGAFIFLVSMTTLSSGQVEHVILKLDRKRPKAASDEVMRHQAAPSRATPARVRSGGLYDFPPAGPPRGVITGVPQSHLYDFSDAPTGPLPGRAITGISE